jgi:crotonobetainyl-CoA:carnitine CoA-transferase CaiB-like acyl-CoA transferase
MYGVIGILSALAARERIGRGQHVDVSLLDTGVAWFTVLAGTYWATGEVPGPLGSRSALFAPYQAFMASDGWLTIVGTGGVNGWADFCAAVDLPDLVDDPRFRTNGDRIANLDQLEPILAARFATAPVAEWVSKLKAVGLPAAPINRLNAVLRDPQVVARDLVLDIDHPVDGTFKAIGVPIKLSETPPSVRRRPPKLGEHQHEGFERRAPGTDR